MNRPPKLIFFLLFLDVLLGVAYLINNLAGSPFPRLSHFLDLNGESNLPTWYSSVKWYTASGFLVLANFSHSIRDNKFETLFKLILPCVFLAMSLDEVAQFHEWLGNKSDALLPGGQRETSLFKKTGIWMFVIGIPFVCLCGLIYVFSLKLEYYPKPMLTHIFLGLSVISIGAFGVETLQNFVDDGSLFFIVQVIFEECLELAGTSLVLWGCYEAYQARAFTST